MHQWTVSSVVLLFALIAVVIGLVLALSVVTKKDGEVEHDRANTTRSTLILLVAIALVMLVVAVQRLELGEAVKHLMA